MKTRQQTIKQIDRLLMLALADLGLGFTHYQEYIHTERGDGKIILGRHVGVYFRSPRISRDKQNQVARIFRRYWHRAIRLRSCKFINIYGSDANREVVLTF